MYFNLFLLFMFVCSCCHLCQTWYASISPFYWSSFLSIMKKLILFSIPFFLLLSCGKEVAEDLKKKQGPNNCDTSNITFTANVQPILNSGLCLSCHTGPGAFGNVRLDSYQAAADIAPKMLKAIKHDPSLGISQWMPPGGKLNDCQILQIEAWINQGLKE